MANHHRNNLQNDAIVAKWLIVVWFFVLAMLMVGGATRLTDSGLSIAHWAPIHGMIPPLSNKDWQAEFALYKAIPEYKFQNQGMSLNDFKFIFWWEWSHRFLGRIFGLIYIIPLFVFWFKGILKIKDVPMIFFTALLIGLQGFIGWWMVSSGLKGTMLDVAAYRLAIHLGMAFLLLGLISIFIFERTLEYRQTNFSQDWFNPWLFVVFLTFCQVLMGAIVAGTDSGLLHNDWPLIDGHLLPNKYFELSPIWNNFIENTQNIQFNHRMLAYALSIMVVLTWFKANRIARFQHRVLATLLLFAIFIQVGLGVLTLHIFSISPPPAIHGVLMGVSHQGFAAIVFVLTILTWRTYTK